MPLYEFQCRDCDAQFESLVLGGEPVECPECASFDLEKLFSVPAAPKVQPNLTMTCDPNTPACGPTCRKLID